MGMTIAEKIIAAAAGVDYVKPGDIHTVTLDRMMSNDGTTHLTVDMYRNKLKHPHIADTKKMVFIVDHNVPSDCPKTAASQKKMRDFAKENNIDFWAFADLFAPALILAQSVGRMANLLNGDAFGHPTGGNFGILYPESTLAHRTYGNQPLWPAEIWEGQIDILIFVALLLFSSFKHAKGQVFVLYAILYSTARFFLEFLRGDYVDLTLGLKSAQMTSLIVIIVGICLFIYLGYLEKKNQPVLETTETAPKTKKRK